MNVTLRDCTAASRQSSQMIAAYSFISKEDPYHAMMLTSAAPLRFDDVPATPFPQRYVTAFSQMRHGVSGGLMQAVLSFAYVRLNH